MAGRRRWIRNAFLLHISCATQKGKLSGALAAVRKQLDKFPTDYEGQMLLAELQAENLNDLPGAETTLMRLAVQPGLAPANVASALNRLADWHLNLTKDRESARLTLEKIRELLPDTEMALQAAQRIARLSDINRLLAPHDRQRMTVRKGEQRLGLVREQGKLKVAEIDQGKLAEDYVKHLDEHPLDTLMRGNNLQQRYTVSHYQWLDLAVEQLEQLIQQPGHAPKQVVHWLNLMADLQVKGGGEPEDARQTLQRILEQYPDTAAAESARRRLDILKLEFNTKAEKQSVPLGVYEQNIGLRRKH